MSLIDSMMEECTVYNKIRVPDGEGGSKVTWEEGITILAAITFDSSMQSRIAEAQGVKSTFTITTRRDVVLDYHEVIRRNRDGAIFRVTSNGTDKKSPTFGTLDISQCTAEKWELTT